MGWRVNHSKCTLLYSGHLMQNMGLSRIVRLTYYEFVFMFLNSKLMENCACLRMTLFLWAPPAHGMRYMIEPPRAYWLLKKGFIITLSLSICDTKCITITLIDESYPCPRLLRWAKDGNVVLWPWRHWAWDGVSVSAMELLAASQRDIIKAIIYRDNRHTTRLLLADFPFFPFDHYI